MTEHVHDSKLQWIDEVFTGHQTLNHHCGSRIYHSIPPQLDVIFGAFRIENKLTSHASSTFRSKQTSHNQRKISILLVLSYYRTIEDTCLTSWFVSAPTPGSRFLVCEEHTTSSGLPPMNTETLTCKASYPTRGSVNSLLLRLLLKQFCYRLMVALRRWNLHSLQGVSSSKARK